MTELLWGLIQIFSREYIIPGEAPSEWGRLLSSALQLRSRALYDALATLRRDDAEEVLELARAILAFLEEKVTKM